MSQQISFDSTLNTKARQSTSAITPFEENKPVTQNEDKKQHMDILLRQARRSLEEVLKPDFLQVTNDPLQLLKEAKGILFATILKGGEIGAGIVFLRVSDKWSLPCAVLIENAKLGLALEFDRTKHILVFKNDQFLKKFINANDIILQDDDSIFTLSIGKDYDFNVEIHESGYEEIKKVSTVKGTNLEDTLDGLKIRVDDKWNLEFYGKSVTVKEIFSGNILAPLDEDYDALCNMLNQYSLLRMDQQNINAIGDVNQNTNLNERNTNFPANNLGTENTTNEEFSNTSKPERSKQSESTTRTAYSYSRTTDFSINPPSNITETHLNINTSTSRNDIKPDTTDKNFRTDSSTNTNIAGSNDTSTTHVYPSNMIGADNKQTNYNVGLSSHRKN